MNIITIMGRLTREPEMRTTNNGVSVASFTVAVDREFGEKQTDFIDCVAWRQTGEFVTKYFHKGSMIALTGRLQSRTWNDRDGNKRTSWEVVTESVYFCGDKKSSDTGSKRPVNVHMEELGDEDGELPF